MGCYYSPLAGTVAGQVLCLRVSGNSRGEFPGPKFVAAAPSPGTKYNGQILAWQLNCPVPIDARSERVTVAHAGGARLTPRLIEPRIYSQFGSLQPQTLADAAQLTPSSASVAITTDSFVVASLFFTCGDAVLCRW